MTGYVIEVKVARGYELPAWHRADHGTLESAQSEVVKLRQWEGTSRAIRSMVIRPAK